MFGVIVVFFASVGLQSAPRLRQNVIEIVRNYRDQRNGMHITTRDTSHVLVHYMESREDYDYVCTLTYIERTIGQWHHDIVVLNPHNITGETHCDDEVTFVHSFDLPLIAVHRALQDHLAKYTVVQYQDIDVVVTSPMNRLRPEAFSYTDVLLLDTPCKYSYGDGSILDSLPAYSIEQRLILGDYTGANTPTNGPNKSPAGGMLTFGILVPRFKMHFKFHPPPETISRLMLRYRHLNMEQAMMLAYWGFFKTHAGMFRTECYGGALGGKRETSLIWTTRENRTSNPHSIYYPFYFAMSQARLAGTE
jgi:hypothetical protein